MNILPHGVKLNTFKLCMRKRVHITYTTISPNFIFILCYQHQVLNLMHLVVVWILLPYRFTWENKLWNTAYKNPLPRKSFFGMVSTLWYLLFSTIFYWGKRTNLKFKNIIVDTVSTNICPLCGTYFYVNRRTKFKCINMFFGMVTQFQKNSQWACYVTNFLLTGRWKYCTRNSQMAHGLPQDIAINKSILNIKYISSVDYQAWLISHQKPNYSCPSNIQ